MLLKKEKANMENIKTGSVKQRRMETTNVYKKCLRNKEV